jgi:hypothetical protein
LKASNFCDSSGRSELIPRLGFPTLGNRGTEERFIFVDMGEVACCSL